MNKCIDIASLIYSEHLLPPFLYTEWINFQSKCILLIHTVYFISINICHRRNGSVRRNGLKKEKKRHLKPVNPISYKSFN